MIFTSNAGGRTREDDGAAAPLSHVDGRLFGAEEAGEARHLPYLAEDAGTGVGHLKTHIGADIEAEQLNRADVAFNTSEELLNGGLVPRVAGKDMHLSLPPELFL